MRAGNRAACPTCGSTCQPTSPPVGAGFPLPGALLCRLRCAWLHGAFCPVLRGNAVVLQSTSEAQSHCLWGCLPP